MICCRCCKYRRGDLCTESWVDSNDGLSRQGIEDSNLEDGICMPICEKGVDAKMVKPSLSAISILLVESLVCQNKSFAKRRGGYRFRPVALCGC